MSKKSDEEKIELVDPEGAGGDYGSTDRLIREDEAADEVGKFAC